MNLHTNALLALLAALALASPAQARYNGEDRGRPVLPAQSNAKWQQECSACHMAFPPGLLPAASWKKVMQGLNQHFGTDASLSPQDTAEITDFLVKNPSNRWTSNAAPLRVTQGEWFKSKHLNSGKIAPAVWQRPSVKSAANCMACHQGADKGIFDDHGIKIPQ